MTRFKKTIGIVLTLLMALSFVLPVLAQEQKVTPLNLIDGGICGDNATWKIDDKGVLTISGTGAVFDYFNYYDEYEGVIHYYERPWEEVKLSVKTIVIEEGITRIGSCAFYGCSSLTSVSIPDSVETIGVYAFYGCLMLTDVSLPANLKELGYCAFGMTGLTSFRFPRGTTVIEENALINCGSLREVTIPEGVTEIGASAFFGCTNLTKVTLPETLTVIRKQAFEGSGITEIDIPSSVTKIEERAFANCKKLVSITIPETVEELGNAMFSGCERLSEAILLCEVTRIPYEMFYNCTNLRSVTIPRSVVTVEEGAFDNCYNLSNVKYGGNKYDWAKIFIDVRNDALLSRSLDIYYNELIGDVNENGKLDSGDATLVLRKIVGNGRLTDKQIKAGDANNSGYLEAGDATLILRWALAWK